MWLGPELEIAFERKKEKSYCKYCCERELHHDIVNLKMH